MAPITDGSLWSNEMHSRHSRTQSREMVQGFETKPAGLLCEWNALDRHNPQGQSSLVHYDVGDRMIDMGL